MFVSNFRYAYTYDSNYIEVEEYCKDEGSFMYTHMEGRLQMLPGPKSIPTFIRRFEETIYGKNISNINLCKENVKNMAFVKFEMTTEITNKIKKTKRVSYADILSTIGENLIRNQFIIVMIYYLILKITFDKLLLIFKNDNLALI